MPMCQSPKIVEVWLRVNTAAVNDNVPATERNRKVDIHGDVVSVAAGGLPGRRPTYFQLLARRRRSEKRTQQLTRSPLPAVRACPRGTDRDGLHHNFVNPHELPKRIDFAYRRQCRVSVANALRRLSDTSGIGSRMTAAAAQLRAVQAPGARRFTHGSLPYRA